MNNEELLVCEDETARYYDAHARVCRLPASTPRQAVELLETVATGGALGTGGRLAQLGVEIPRIRGEYERQVRLLIDEVARREGTMPVQQLAQWASAERVRIARSMRWQQGPSSVVLLEARDAVTYGWGGRTFPNMVRRYGSRGYQGSAAYERILRGATTPNVELSATAMRGARYLRHGGRVIVVASVVTTGYRILNTPKAELPRVLSEEGGGLAGGALGAEAAVGLCLVFGIATGGWGLLACGVLGGIGGGILGAEAGNRIYYAASNEVVTQGQTEAVIDRSELTDSMPLMCY